MSDQPPDPRERSEDDLASLARESSGSLLSELWGFLKVTKKWWLAPIIAVLLLVALLVILGSSSVAPFIYTLF